ncbi:MAG: acyl-CoA synthetase, partial [Erythrobacter sp. RIFCSPHIGHO2_12_FULL_63_10]
MKGHHRHISFDEILRFWAGERPDRPAFEQDGRIIRFSELEEWTRRIIALFHARGLKPGDRICWLGKNSDHYYTLFLAAARCGVVTVPIGWRLAAPEVGFIIKDTCAKLVFTGDEFAELVAGIALDLPEPPEVIAQTAARKLIATHRPGEFTPASSSDPVLQLYTSGTTGNPKGAVLSSGNLLGLRSHAIEAGLPWAFYEPDDCMLVAMPCAHIGGTGLVVASVANGIRALVLAEFNPTGVLDAIENGATHMFIVPAALQMVVHHPRAAETDFSNLKYLMYGAAPMPIELLKEAVRAMPNTGFLQVYGMTETSGTVTCLPPEDHALNGNKRMRSAGKAVPGVEIKVVDQQGQELPLGEIGEIVVRSPSNMAGYWHLPEASAEALRDGWMHTGDAAVMDEDGYIYIQDRIKDMIITGGENVYPAEVESAIYGHPAIAEVAVIGIPSERWGEEVKACVVAKPGMTVDEGDVIAWARERLAAFKAPKSIA